MFYHQRLWRIRVNKLRAMRISNKPYTCTGCWSNVDKNSSANGLPPAVIE